ncbi:MAG: M20/M25/M40 family metallo-hydrolase [Synergistetes bacterium]|nr:M20/M25/M40 family metallo-hydrolase [Synergistota bacterium]MCX8128386.1 M20/M25/M40 family metallo-hydrolase [Synergistota bacterium]MDW8192422.1 M20/M25/M40 family metallo-hydrolase [Synergistota bacterium]
MCPIELLRRMVEIKSFAGEEKEIGEFLLDASKNLNFDEAYLDEVGNFIAVRGKGQTEVYLVGHMDTAPGWIEPRIDGDLLYGRGSVDAKGPLAAFIVAASEVSIPEHLKLVVVGAVEEEGPSTGALHLLKKVSKPPSYLIIGEPSGIDGVTLGYKGSLFIKKSFISEVSHPASGNDGAIEEGLRSLNDISKLLEGLNEGRDGSIDRVDIKVREIRSFSDGLFERLDLGISFRLPLWLDPDDLLNILGDGWVPHFKAKAYKCDRSNPLVSAFNRAIRRRGLTPKHKMKSGTADMNLLAPAWGCPSVAYGPGDSSLDHTPREHINLKEYLISIEILKDVLSSIPPTL